MSAAEPEILDAEPVEAEVKVTDRRHGAIARRDRQEIAERAPGGIEDLMAKAVETGNMDTIERVFALRQELKREAAKEAFFEALSVFQGRVPKIPKRKKGYGYFYAPIGDIEAGIQKAMDAAQLSKRWEQDEGENQLTMRCIVTHIKGHSETTSIGPVGWDLLEKTERMNSLQHRAAVISYLQRYTLIAALGIATADDTDGALIPEDVRDRSKQQSRQPVSQPRSTPTAQKAAAQAKANDGEKKQIGPAAEQEATIEESTMKLFSTRMSSGALSLDDFKKRFPAFSELDNPIPHIKRSDLNAVINWIADPAVN